MWVRAGIGVFSSDHGDISVSQPDTSSVIRGSGCNSHKIQVSDPPEQLPMAQRLNSSEINPYETQNIEYLMR